MVTPAPPRAAVPALTTLWEKILRIPSQISPGATYLPSCRDRLQDHIPYFTSLILQPNLGPDKMVIDLTDPNRPRFTLQELRDVLQERNQLKAQLLVVQEELQCYKSGIISQRKDETKELEKEPRGSRKDSSEKTIVKRLFSFKHGK